MRPRWLVHRSTSFACLLAMIAMVFLAAVVAAAYMPTSNVDRVVAIPQIDLLQSANPCEAGDEADFGEWFDWQILHRNDPKTTVFDEQIGSNYGFSVAVDGDLMVVGANRETIEAEIGRQTVTNPEAGRVYVFRHHEGEWRRAATLEPPDECLQEGLLRFGSSVAVAASEEQDVIVVGASLMPHENVQGAVYVYRRTGATWPEISEETWIAEGLPIQDEDDDNDNGVELTPCQQQPRLIGSFPTLQFGASVGIARFEEQADGNTIGGDIIVVGSPWSIIGNDDCANFHVGSTYVFRFDPEEGDWHEEDVLTGECAPQELFGWSVAIYRAQDTGQYRIASSSLFGNAVVPNDDPDEPSEVVGFAGAVRLFGLYEFFNEDGEVERHWKPQAIFHSPCPQPGAEFGHSVDTVSIPLRGDRLVIGSPFQNPYFDQDCEIIDGMQGEFPGAAFVYDRPINQFAWILEDMLLAGDDEEEPQHLGEFGISVGIGTGTIVVGSPRKDGPEDNEDEPVPAVGAAYLYAFDGDQWSFERELAGLRALADSAGSQFGFAVDLKNDSAIVGAWAEPILDNGDLFQAGAAYAFGRCQDCPGEGNCFVADGSPGCEDESCCLAVCQIDPFCCSLGWDGPCVSLATLTPACAPPVDNCPGTGNCCLVNDTPGCSDEGCCQFVCAEDPACCVIGQEWDQFCVDLAVDLCGCPPVPPTCAGACGLDDPDGSGICSCAPDCITDPNVDCCPDVCFFCPLEDPANFDWCIAFDVCPGTGDCCEANGTPGCAEEQCCQDVCVNDPFCCEVEWDECCAALAGVLCTAECPDSAPSCENQCGEADPDGCGICSCAPDCIIEDNCCGDVCEFCDEEAGFEAVCPDDLPTGGGQARPGDGEPARPRSPRAAPSASFGSSAPAPLTSPLMLPPDHADHALGVSSTAPKRR